VEHFADRTFTDLLDAVPDAIVCTDGTGRIVLANAQAGRLFGYRRDELAGQPVEICVPDLDPARRAAVHASPQSQPDGPVHDLRARRRDGSTFSAEVSVTVLRTDYGTLVIAAVRDVSQRLAAEADRARIERRLDQSRRLECLSELAGEVAHDFSTMLGVIINYTSILREEMAGRLPADQAQSFQAPLNQIQEAGQRAAGRTHQLLAFARQETGQPRALNLNELVSQVHKLLLRTLGEHVELVTDLALGLSPVLADPRQVEEVLLNLSANACDAMPAGGRLTIQTANLYAEEPVPGATAALPAGQYVMLKVSDTGAGIPQEMIDRVIEPFVTTKPEGQGTGLGLATVYGIVSQAGGRLEITSEPGLGTVVTALLPATTSQPAAAHVPAARPPHRRGAGQTVLVVEDEPALREVTRRILTRNGYEVLTAADGAQALRLCTEHPSAIHALLTDVVMPHMPGRELADKVKRRRPRIQVLFMSGYSPAHLHAQGVLEPGAHLVEKPFDQPTLLARLHGLLTVSPAGKD
jgi:PAS domain S-box-containing protein